MRIRPLCCRSMISLRCRSAITFATDAGGALLTGQIGYNWQSCVNFPTNASEIRLSWLSVLAPCRRGGSRRSIPESIRKIFLLQCGALAAFLYLFPQYAYPLIIVAIIGLLWTLAMGRKAIIFTEAEVIYRPPFSQPRRVRISMIQGLTRSVVLVAYLLRASPRPGMTI